MSPYLHFGQLSPLYLALEIKAVDGRDPNSYTGVAWIFGVHDRAWFERPIFGKVRYMAASGLERKCDIRGYVKKSTPWKKCPESHV